MSNRSFAVFLDRSRELLRQDWRKVVIAAGTCVLAVALVCRFVLRGPVPAPAAVLQSSWSDNEFTETNSPPPITSPQAISEWLKQSKQPPKRNVFALNLEDYPTDSAPARGGNVRLSNDQKDQELWNDVAKSLAAQADHKREQDLRIKNLQRAAAKLIVQQISVGPPAKAQVNGTDVEEGSIVASFRVMRIGRDRITFEKNGITLDVPAH